MSNFTHSKWQENTQTPTPEHNLSIEPSNQPTTSLPTNLTREKENAKQNKLFTHAHTHTFIVIPIYTQSRNKELNSIEGREEKTGQTYIQSTEYEEAQTLPEQIEKKVILSQLT